MDNEKLKSNITSPEHWLRLVYMVLFAVMLYVAGIVMSFLVVVQFIFALVTGRDNANLRQLGDSLSQFIYAALRFLTYNSDEKPFPFAEWPKAEPVEEELEPTPPSDTPAKAEAPSDDSPDDAEPKDKS